MAHCLSNSLIINDNDKKCDNDNQKAVTAVAAAAAADTTADDDYEVFCENFQFVNSSSCWVCNGYYGPNFDEPICGTCHAFLFPASLNENVEHQTKLSDDEDSGNDEPPYNIISGREQREEPSSSSSLDNDVSVNLNDNEYNILPAPTVPQNLNQYLDRLSEPSIMHGEISNENIHSLPPEVLISIFKYLDDISLWNAGDVCKQWKEIIQRHTTQTLWKKYTQERWPLFEQLYKITNWFKMYSALMSSCFCRTCLIQMALKIPLFGRVQSMRTKRLRTIDIRSLDIEPDYGIDAVPLDNQLSHWQASILGPIGSPYEGGKFFLYVVIPLNYPMNPPIVRFLTKIAHPNISRHGDVGIDIIINNWSVAYTLSKLLISLQSLLTDPFTDICMEPELGRMYENDRSKFEALARRWTWKYAMYEVMSPFV